MFDFGKKFIVNTDLPATSAAYPEVRYAAGSDGPSVLYSRVAWFPATAGSPANNVYVLFVGTAESIEKHVPAISDVCARGNHVMVFEFAGQGGSGRFLLDQRKVHALPDGFDMWTDSLKEFMRSNVFRAARQLAYDGRLGFVALPYSLGGHMFARAMQEAPALSKRFTHIVYVNPVVAMNSARSMIARLGQQVFAAVSVAGRRKADEFVPGHGRHHPGDRPLEKSSIGSDRTRHEWICRFYHDNEHLAMWGMTYGWFHEANRSLSRMWAHISEGEANNPITWVAERIRGRSLPRANVYRVPALVISSQQDTIVIAHYVRRFARYIGADLLLLPRAKHEPSQEPAQIREATFDAVAAWVRQPAAPAFTTSPDVRFLKRRP
jgi:alpha-beta hydrolase superfamily lysophospholipase